jgi:Na+-driven multidrug efflux pump
MAPESANRASLDWRRALFLHGPITRALVTLAVPIILANILQTGYQLTDSF